MGPVTWGHLIDSDILIYHVNGQLGPETWGFLRGLFRKPVYVSVISRMEVLGWHGHSDDSWETAKELLNELREIGLDEDVVQTTIRMRRAMRIKLPDAIIAASALSRGLALVTRNADDFCRVPGLSLVNPFDY
jgi:toxin FitB